MYVYAILPEKIQICLQMLIIYILYSVTDNRRLVYFGTISQTQFGVYDNSDSFTKKNVNTTRIEHTFF